MRSVVQESYDFGVVLANEPLLLMEDDVLTEGQCQHLISQAKNKLKLGDDGVVSSCWLKHEQTPIVRNVVRRVADLVGIPLQNAESLQVTHYAEGHEINAKFDAFDLTTDQGTQSAAKGGQRLVTAQLYLNTVESGGRTGFPKLDLDIPAIEGRMVLLHNTRPGTVYIHPDAQHTGMWVETGERWMANLFFREEITQTGGVGRPRTPGARVGSGKGGANRKKGRKNQKASRKKNR